MFFKSLELQGFKSFPDRVKLEFEQGLTAVVGPNGSGKSNIGDAIRWGVPCRLHYVVPISVSSCVSTGVQLFSSACNSAVSCSALPLPRYPIA